MILVIDNYDSFVYNLVRYLEILGFKSIVKRNDEITIQEIYKLSPSHILISPGPKAPIDSGVCLKLVTEFAGKIPILGVCLGMQAIGEALGSKVVEAKKPVHGKFSLLKHNGSSIFHNLPQKLKVARYHSLILDYNSTYYNPKLEIIATTNDIIMAIKHSNSNTIGLQFHPESILTEKGLEILQNFVLLS